MKSTKVLHIFLLGWKRFLKLIIPHNLKLTQKDKYRETENWKYRTKEWLDNNIQMRVSLNYSFNVFTFIEMIGVINTQNVKSKNFLFSFQLWFI